MKKNAITPDPAAPVLYLQVAEWKIGHTADTQVLMHLTYRDQTGILVDLPVGLLRPEDAESIGNGLLQAAQHARQRIAMTPTAEQGTTPN
jgi:hypothetical protein